MIDIIKFDEACRTVNSGGRLIKGIGTKCEKSVHAVLKNYYEPFHDSQEQKIGGYIADIVGENGIIEIQTGHFSSLNEKLNAFLPVSRVTVVFPVFTKKRIITLDGETGEVKSRRTSPVKETAYEIFPNLFPICEYLTHENLSFIITLLEADELRVPPESVGRKKRRRGRLSVIDRIPTALTGEICINSPRDWEQLVPCLFEEDHTTEDLANSANISRETAQTALSALFRGGVVMRTGKKGNAYTYRFHNG
ncbi:MAG: hypothetical protein ACI4J0_07330 [Huintestinicola sp.]|uniref:hypothetical protein n=1 Tax=Huintestinicola sp. TaxID=2981661 RepID=UPI003F105FE4